MSILAFLYILSIFASTLVFWFFTVPACNRGLEDLTSFEKNSPWIVLGLALWPIALMTALIILSFAIIGGAIFALEKSSRPLFKNSRCDS